MREGIHPEYHQATVTCNCGNTFTTGSTKETSTWKSVPNAIRSIQVSRKQLRLAAVLTSSTRNMVLNKNDTLQAEVRSSQPLCCFKDRRHYESSNIGGQAVLEGIMMRNGPKYSVAVRRPDGEIAVDVKDYKSVIPWKTPLKIPFIRGIFNFVDSLVLGMRTNRYTYRFF